MKKVLVLMASYNGEKYIDQQIQSLFDQEGVAVQMLVRDDGSTDSTVSRLEQWTQTSNTAWYTGEHLNAKYGFYDLMTKALDTDAPYYAFCDQDDVWDTDKLKIAVDALEQTDPDVPALYYCGQRLVDAELNPLSDHTLNPHRTVRTRFLLSDIAGCTAVFNRALLEAVAAYRPTYMRMHDLWIMKVCAALGGSVIVDSQSHIAYRQHGNNVEGLSNSLRNKINRFGRYFRHSITAHMEQLKLGYDEKLVPEYRELIDLILQCKTNPGLRWKLLRDWQIDFYNHGLNLVFFLKVLCNKI